MIDSDTLELSFGFLLEKLYVVVEALPKKWNKKKNQKNKQPTATKTESRSWYLCISLEDGKGSNYF